ncbi:creatininase family protein [Halorubrum sp. SP9]|uniref:creatininase family protein n=1 Tax=Halorubrum sp. SP9 TaxID=1537267 RepID=UPI0010F51EBC|nr:creatininase family protein [Halorubrum sp. SP9]TKX70034.1 creatininase family protein [Halorubrum sp. SP9]
MPETDADLFGMTWEDAGDAIDGADFAVLPTGSTEQHGPHLPVSTDTLRADHLTAELVDAADEFDLDLLRLPTLPYGQSEHHMRFPGTVTLSTETYVDVVREIGESVAEHGVDRLLIVNCHGGNREPLSIAADRLGRDTDLTVHFVHWTDFAEEDLEEAYGEGWGHAGDHETSFVELYRPDLVRSEKKEPQEADEMPRTRSYEYFDEVTELGGLGDPTNSDPDALEPIVVATTREILGALVEDLDAGW